jgi:prefoldin alpha subunit
MRDKYMTKEDELNKYMAQIEYYKEQINQLETQIQYLQAAINDYSRAKITLEKLDKTADGTELLLPIGGSTYINSIAKTPSKVLFDIGNGIITEKTSKDAIKKINERTEQLQKTQDKIGTMIEQLQEEAGQISSKAQELLSKQQ